MRKEVKMTGKDGKEKEEGEKRRGRIKDGENREIIKFMQKGKW